MKKHIKKFICVMLVLVLMTSVAILPASAENETADYPIVYVMGKNQSIYNSDGKQIYPLEKSTTDYIKDGIEPVTKALLAALATDDWNIYYDSIYNAIAPIYKEIIADKNGNVNEGDYINHVNNVGNKTSGFTLNDYHFCYDWRLDPNTIAEELHEYVTEIKSKSGKNKVNLIGRCYGGNVVSAYITKYGCDDIEQVLLCAPSAMGVNTCGAMFSGKIEFTPEVLDKYLNYNFDSENEPFLGLIQAFVPILRQLSVLGLGTDMVNKICNKIFSNVLPRILRSSYASFPSYWAMVGTEYFEDAKQFVFAGVEDEYSGLIEKIDRYQYDVQQKLPQTIKEYQSKGMKYANISKYNTQQPPLTASADEQADGQVALFEQSIGATSAPIGQTFNSAYIDKATENGTVQYISADKKVDASTCISPDSTWFIKNIAHDAYPNSVSALMFKILCSKEQMTVWDYDEYPQFMAYDQTTQAISKIEAEDDTDSKWSNNIFLSFIRFIKSFFNWIASLFKK